MTEDEAKTKACCGPQVIAMTIALTSPAMVAELIENPGRCIASACMAWRGQAEDRPVLRDGREVKPGEPFSTKEVAEWRRYIIGGYCGLAGALQ